MTTQYLEDKETRDWVIRYAKSEEPSKQYIFAGYKSNGDVKYAWKYANMARYRTPDEAFVAALELVKHGDYIVDVKKIHVVGDIENSKYYFSGGTGA